MDDDKTAVAACDCIARIDAHLADKNTKVTRNIMLLPAIHESGALIRTEKVDPAKRGRPTTLMATYCPFCGVKYPKDDGVMTESEEMES